MKKICFLAPLDSTKDFNILVGNLRDICNNKYDFKVIALCDININPNLRVPNEIVFVKTEEGTSFDEKIRLGFQYTANYDITIVMDYNNTNYRSYIEGMLDNYEKGYDIVYIKNGVEPQGFFNKIKGFFRNIFKKTSQFFVKLLCGTEDLDIYNGFQLFSKPVAEIILSLNEQNKYLRNFDCFNGFRTAYIFSSKSEKQKRRTKFWTKRFIIGLVLSIVGVVLLVTSFATYSIIKYSFRFTYLSLGIMLSVGLLFFGIYFLTRNSLDKKLGK